LLNSVDRDGVMSGYDTTLCELVSKQVDEPVIIASGCGSKQDCAGAIKHHASAIAAGSVFIG
jgi:cyclase